MTTRNNHPGRIKLTMKTAKELARRELGTAKGLMAEPCSMKGYYCMALGNLVVRLHPDWSGKSGCIVLAVGGTGTGEYVQLHDPETLEQNLEAEETRMKDMRREQFEDWVQDHGLDYCREKIEQAWSREQ